jgi:hypothetical protein
LFDRRKKEMKLKHLGRYFGNLAIVLGITASVTIPLLADELSDIMTKLQSNDAADKGNACVKAADYISKNPDKASILLPLLINQFTDTTPLGWAPFGIPSILLTSPAQEAHNAIVKIGTTSVPMLQDKHKENLNDMMNIWCMATLQRLGQKDGYVEKILGFLSDKDELIRENAAWSLGHIHVAAASVTSKLSDLLKGEKESRVRLAAEWALFQIDRHAALPFLITEIEKDGNITYACMALEEMGKEAEPSVPALAKLLQDKNSGIIYGLKAMEVLGNIQTKESAEAISYVLDYPETLGTRGEEMRDAACLAMTKMGAFAKPYMSTLLKIAINEKENWLRRQHAIEALGNIGTDAREVLPSLQKFLDENKDLTIEEALKMAIRNIKGYK